MITVTIAAAIAARTVAAPPIAAMMYWGVYSDRAFFPPPSGAGFCAADFSLSPKGIPSCSDVDCDEPDEVAVQYVALPPVFEGVGVGTGLPLDLTAVAVGGGGVELERVGLASFGEGSAETVGVAAAVAGADADPDTVGLPAVVAVEYLTMGFVVPSDAMVPAWLVCGSL